MIATAPAAPLPVRSVLEQLRTELVDLAFELEARREFVAADLAVATAARLAEIGVAGAHE